MATTQEDWLHWESWEPCLARRTLIEAHDLFALHHAVALIGLRHVEQLDKLPHDLLEVFHMLRPFTCHGHLFAAYGDAPTQAALGAGRQRALVIAAHGNLSKRLAGKVR